MPDVLGLPLHPLVVHGAVVLLVVNALAVAAAVLLPRFRSWLAWGLPVLGVASALTGWTARLSGGDLYSTYEESGLLSDAVETHGAWGLYAAVASLVLEQPASCCMPCTRRSPRSAGRGCGAGSCGSSSSSWPWPRRRPPWCSRCWPGTAARSRSGADGRPGSAGAPRRVLAGAVDTLAVLSLIQDVADRVITPRFRDLTAGQVAEKNPGDLVTVADHEAEVLLTQALRAAYPDAVMLGEEAHASDPGLLAAFRRADHAFTIDPVDGTKNFVHGSPDHAVMVAEVRAGSTVRAWLWQPQHEAAYVAERGAGAQRNGLPLHPRAGEPGPGGPAGADVTAGLAGPRPRGPRPAGAHLGLLRCGLPQGGGGGRRRRALRRDPPVGPRPGGSAAHRGGGLPGHLRRRGLCAAGPRPRSGGRRRRGHLPERPRTTFSAPVSPARRTRRRPP
jgi:hypothetical protein